jgi:hypothetical protein
MDCIEIAAKESPFVQAMKPVSWMKAMDVMKGKCAAGRSFLSYSEVEDIAVNMCGTEVGRVPEILKFFSEMGVVLWHEDESLKNVVIMDPVEYFVKPATMIIRDYSREDHTKFSKAHKRAMISQSSSFNRLKEDGIADTTILKLLLED